jgi:hypothetical protein
MAMPLIYSAPRPSESCISFDCRTIYYGLKVDSTLKAISTCGFAIRALIGSCTSREAE